MLRTKRWMSDQAFAKAMLYYPALLGAELLPSGVPAGLCFFTKLKGLTANHRSTNLTDSKAKLIVRGLRQSMCAGFCVSTPPLSAIAAKRPIGADVRDNILSHLPALRSPIFQLNRAADHLENWVNGVLDLEPLLDVRARPS